MNCSPPARFARQFVLLIAVAILIATAAGGCASSSYLTLRNAPHNPLAERLSLWSHKGPQPSERTMQYVRSYGLADDLDDKPKVLLTKIQAIVDREPSPDGMYAFAELAYLGGEKMKREKQPQEALDLFGLAVAHAYLYLLDPRFGDTRNPYDPQFRRACEVYNASLEAALRIAKQNGGLRPGATQTVALAGQTWDITVAVRDGLWPAEDFGRFEFVSDYKVTGLQNQYHTYGLGVPLIVVRQDNTKSDPAEPYYAPGLAFPMTAFVRLVSDQPPSAAAAGSFPPGPAVVASGPPSNGPPSNAPPATHHQAVIELYDPMTSSEVEVCGRRIPLETDLSTPLAYCLDDPAFQKLDASTLNLLRPDSKDALTGLYMLEPYQPNKIPVLMIHGLWSSPTTWMEMFNDLRATPELRANYQFWFYCYPSGQTFWTTATQLRDTLTDLRTRLDPQHHALALDQMVLVGHSMGGLVARMQTLESGDDFWHVMSDRPLQLVKAEAPVKQNLAETFYFHPNPAVRRVITIATPYRGSNVSNDATQWLGRKIISLPKALALNDQRLRRDNPDFFRSPSLIDVTNAIDSLSPKSTILPVLLTSQRAPWVEYHNIVGRLPQHDLLGRVTGDGDGVVPYTSAHLDTAASEIEVPADHTDVHRHPLAILEVRRILLEQIGELRQNPYGPPRVTIATRPGGKPE